MLESLGRRIDGFMRREGWWRSEVFRFLKGRRRALSLHDYSTEKELIDSVPHEEIPIPAQKRSRGKTKNRVRTRRGAEDQCEWF
jgi:hypothetical protein